MIKKEEVLSYIDKMQGKLIKNNMIDSRFYGEYDVKRGLRNSNGTGVLVGLTQIGEVNGYTVVEGKKIPSEGELLYRGIDVEDLVNSSLSENRFGYEETSYLLLFGELPTKTELEEYCYLLGELRELPPGFVNDMILTAPSKNIMNKVARSVLALYSYDDNPDDLSVENVLRQSIELIARFPSLASYGYQAKQRYFNNASLHLHLPTQGQSSAENILRLMRPTGEYTQLEATLLDVAMILHAEHGGGNNSAFTTHVISSTNTDTYSAISAAVGSLKGPKHGGANIEVIEMINDLKTNVSDITDYKQIENYLVNALKGNAFDKSGLIYGIGHAVYTLSDPRARLLKEMARKLACEKGLLDDFMIYDYIETRGPELFKEIKNIDKPICANVDLYSGFVYCALDIPIELSTPIFASARISGWCAHRLEELITGGKIMRPAYKGVCERRAFTPLNKR